MTEDEYQAYFDDGDNDEETPMTTSEIMPTPEHWKIAEQFLGMWSNLSDRDVGRLAHLLARREAAARLEGRIEQAREDETFIDDHKAIIAAMLIAARRRELELQRQPPTAKETK